MALVTIKEMLEKARAEKYCVGAFDASTLEMAQTIIAAAEEKKSPVIVMGLPFDLVGDMAEYWIDCISKMAERASVPVCLHLDHAKDMDYLKKCIDLGITSVMYDGSTLPLEENIALTKEAAEYAHAHGATIEAELGHVGDGIVSGVVSEDNTYDNPDDYLTDSDELKKFVQETGVDCLAVAIGTAHGVYTHEPKLHFDKLDELNEISQVPMVLHGGSGTPDEQIQLAISKGVCKVNIYSEMLTAYYSELKKKLEESATLAIWVSDANKKPLEAMKKVVQDKMDVLGSTNKA